MLNLTFPLTGFDHFGGPVSPLRLYHPTGVKRASFPYIIMVARYSLLLALLPAMATAFIGK